MQRTSRAVDFTPLRRPLIMAVQLARTKRVRATNNSAWIRCREMCLKIPIFYAACPDPTSTSPPQRCHQTSCVSWKSRNTDGCSNKGFTKSRRLLLIIAIYLCLHTRANILGCVLQLRSILCTSPNCINSPPCIIKAFLYATCMLNQYITIVCLTLKLIKHTWPRILTVPL